MSEICAGWRLRRPSPQRSLQSVAIYVFAYVLWRKINKEAESPAYYIETEKHDLNDQLLMQACL